MIGRSVLISGKGYVRISLNEQETDKAMEELAKFNAKEVARILKFVKGTSLISEINQTELIKILFEKQGIASYTWLGIELDRKVEKEKKAMAKE